MTRSCAFESSTSVAALLVRLCRAVVGFPSSHGLLLRGGELAARAARLGCCPKALVKQGFACPRYGAQVQPLQEGLDRQVPLEVEEEAHPPPAAQAAQDAAKIEVVAYT